MAGFKNDSICREACRAAAFGDPKDAAKIAKAEVDKYNVPGGFASYSLGAAPVAQFELPPSGHGLVTGSVRVKTSAIVKAPFVVGIFSPTYKLDSEQSFPYTYNIP